MEWGGSLFYPVSSSGGNEISFKYCIKEITSIKLFIFFIEANQKSEKKRNTVCRVKRYYKIRVKKKLIKFYKHLFQLRYFGQ